MLSSTHTVKLHRKVNTINHEITVAVSICKLRYSKNYFYWFNLLKLILTKFNEISPLNVNMMSKDRVKLVVRR